MVQISSPGSPEQMSPHAQQSGFQAQGESSEDRLPDIFTSFDQEKSYSSPSPSTMSSGSSNPPIHRKSHRKSRNGCKTCKRRHIRCDENMPQCRNCTKHNVRCAYMESALADGVPDLGITPQIQLELDAWRVTGVYPFPTLRVENQNQPVPARYSETDLRLIHHISSIAAQMQAVDAPSRYAIWTRRVPVFLRIASSEDFVMHSLLGLSASHLSWLTENPATLQLAYQHRGFAFQGLQQAIGSFSKENSDAVLAASILLSWQVTDWRSWASLLRGTTTVIDSMRASQHPSVFSDIIAERTLFSPSLSPRSLIPDTGRDLQVIAHILSSLEPLLTFFAPATPSASALEDLRYFVQGLESHIPVTSASDQFELLHPLRAWLFFLPIDFLKSGRHDVGAMVLLAHFFGVALAVEPLFPAVGAAYFGTMSVGPIEEIHAGLVTMGREGERGLQTMAFPLEMVREFRQRMEWRRGPPGSPTPAESQHGGFGGNGTGGFDLNAFQEFGNGGNWGDDVRRSAAASEVFASAMWRGGE